MKKKSFLKFCITFNFNSINVATLTFVAVIFFTSTNFILLLLEFYLYSLSFIFQEADNYSTDVYIITHRLKNNQNLNWICPAYLGHTLCSPTCTNCTINHY